MKSIKNFKKILTALSLCLLAGLFVIVSQITFFNGGVAEARAWRKTVKPVATSTTTTTTVSPTTNTSPNLLSPPVVSSSFSLDFSQNGITGCLADNTAFGYQVPLFDVWGGYGCVKLDSVNSNNVLSESPAVSTDAGQTHSSLVTGPAFSGNLTFSAQMKTLAQLRTGSLPNPWEMGWLVWNYTDASHFYYFVPKTNGWEIGKEDPAYPGNQRFLATGSTPKFAVGTAYNVTVQQSGNVINVTVKDVNGNTLLTTSTTDTVDSSKVNSASPYTSGKIGFYTEDAAVHFDNINVTQ